MKFLSDENFDNTIGFTAMAIVFAALVGQFAAFAVGFSAKGCGLGAIVGDVGALGNGFGAMAIPVGGFVNDFAVMDAGFGAMAIGCLARGGLGWVGRSLLVQWR